MAPGYGCALEEVCCGRWRAALRFGAQASRLLPCGTVLGWPHEDHDVKHEAKEAPCSGDRQGQRAHDEGAEDEWVHEGCIGECPVTISGADR
jgi:hypothetical protein